MMPIIKRRRSCVSEDTTYPHVNVNNVGVYVHMWTCSEVAATTSWLSLSIFGDGHWSQRCQVGQGLRTSSYIFEMSVMMEELLFNYSHCEMLSIISMVC